MADSEPMPAPMSDERLREIRSRLDTLGVHSLSDSVKSSEAYDMSMDLLTEVERQRAVIAAMRPVVEAVAEHIGAPINEHFRQCAFCANGAVESRLIAHANDCEVEQAQAVVAQHPTATGEGA